MTSWLVQMNQISSTARFINKCDVIDIQFDNGHSREVYLVTSIEDRQRGLSHLPSLETDGMLFAFAAPSLVPFNMSDMLFDVDIAWYDYQGNLLKMTSCSAGLTTPVCSPEAFSYVLEAPVGTIPTTNLKVRY